MCDNVLPDRSQVVDSKDGEMSEWLKEHAWKAKRAIGKERHRNTSPHSQFNDLSSLDARRCDSVNVGISHRSRARLTQFLHTSQLHVLAYVLVFFGRRR